MKENFKSGFAAIIGRPNVGEIHSLMNHLIGQKIAITSKKPQTTRNRIQTVYTCETDRLYFWILRESTRQKQAGRVHGPGGRAYSEGCGCDPLAGRANHLLSEQESVILQSSWEAFIFRCF